jgi:dihydroxyacetone kinase
MYDKAKGTPTFDISHMQIEYGVGVQGEPGIRREEIPIADELDKLLKRMVTALLKELGIKIDHAFMGNYMTSLDMAGASVSIVKFDDELRNLLNSECDTPASKAAGLVESAKSTNTEDDGEKTEQSYFHLQYPNHMR